MTRRYSTYAVDTAGDITPLGDDFVGQAKAFGMTEAEARAWSMLVDDHMDGDKALAWVRAATRGGHDPIAEAEHLIRLRRAFNEPIPGWR